MPSVQLSSLVGQNSRQQSTRKISVAQLTVQLTAEVVPHELQF